MAQTFILSCESTVDLPYSYIEGRGIPVLFYHYTVNGQDYVDDMGRDPEGLTKFYARIAQGALPSTSQLNTYDYMSFLESLLAQGDVLHIAFGSGMTKSVERAQEAAQALREKYPNRRLVVIDSTCSSSGYGMLVDDAADLRDRGEAWRRSKRGCSPTRTGFTTSSSPPIFPITAAAGAFQARRPPSARF